MLQIELVGGMATGLAGDKVHSSVVLQYLGNSYLAFPNIDNSNLMSIIGRNVIQYLDCSL